MNVVGKVGSLISQGMYSVATPFHPFGGAVDIIVVQQQDGTFRSTPWYVRFGKFQGVLKGAEKVVRIEVNGVETNFHMYLDNSGEAYFVREVESSKDGELNGDSKDSDSLSGMREDVSVDYSDNKDNGKENGNIHRYNGNDSGTGEVQVEDGHKTLIVDRLERTESESERRFYEFQDDRSSLEDSVELSEYGSSRYDNLGSVGHMIESQDPNSEMVLVSVDGHILTAPISSSDGNSENVQLSTPQFHLGPGEGIEFVENNEEHNTGEAARFADYPRDSEAFKLDVSSEHIYMKNDGNTSEDHLEVCEGDKEDACQAQDTQGTANQEEEVCIGCDSTDACALLKREDIFSSCLELPALAMQFGNVNQHNVGSPSDRHEDKESLQEKSPQIILLNEQIEVRSVVELRNSEGLTPSESDIPSSMISSDLHIEVGSTEKHALDSNNNGFDGLPVHSVSNERKLEEQIDVALTTGGSESSPQGPAPEDESSKMDIVEPHTHLIEDMEADTSIRCDLSLCRNLLCPGMGLAAAAEVFDAHRISEEEFSVSAASIIKNENLVVRIQERYLPWDKAAPIVLGMAAYGLYLPVEPSEAIPVEQDEAKAKEDDSGITSTSGRKWRLWSIPFRRVKTLEHTSSNLSNEDVFVDTESGFGSPNQLVESTQTPRSSSESPHKHFIRTNVPTTEQIASLNLKEGQNMVTFSFSTRVLGMQKVDAHIYLWKWNARIVISDVDGTITRSDVLGQFMPLVGRDWTQSGVAGLFSAIKENGYKLLFLSARAIVQAYLTRSFLLNLKQDGKALPNGPVVISPDGLFPSLYREVIRRAPHEFKIACLEDIKALFPPDYNPFYAGFGNRDTDELSYRKIGIPNGKIFIINPKGEVAISHRIDVKSYTSLHTLVNDMFPPTSLVEQEDYNSWNYWKMPLPDIDNL